MILHPKREYMPTDIFHLEHRYLYGLRFDGVWAYLVRSAAGWLRWKALPLLEAPSARTALDDPEGTWWCVYQCAAVMSQRARPAAKLPRVSVPRPETEQIEHVLQALLTSYEVQARDTNAGNTMDDLVTVLEGRGCALLRLEGDAGTSTSSRRWVWMVGGEVQCGTESRRVSALLVVGPRWPAPWGSGFGAKVWPLEDGRWKLCSADGQVMQGRLTALVVVKRRVAIT